jgi:hypothetical protein
MADEWIELTLVTDNEGGRKAIHIRAPKISTFHEAPYKGYNKGVASRVCVDGIYYGVVETEGQLIKLLVR